MTIVSKISFSQEKYIPLEEEIIPTNSLYTRGGFSSLFEAHLYHQKNKDNDHTGFVYGIGVNYGLKNYFDGWYCKSLLTALRPLHTNSLTLSLGTTFARMHKNFFNVTQHTILLRIKYSFRNQFSCGIRSGPSLYIDHRSYNFIVQYFAEELIEQKRIVFYYSFGIGVGQVEERRSRFKNQKGSFTHFFQQLRLPIDIGFRINLCGNHRPN